jgi:hypothetical protein
VPGTDNAIWFFTFLTLLANAALVAVLATAAAARLARRSERTDHAATRLWAAVRTELGRGGIAVAWLVAAVATTGSLYFSEVAGFPPCRLCWVQRFAMYPLVALLAAMWIPALRTWSRRLALVLAPAGAVVATYHLFVERYPWLESGTCDPAVPCSLVWFERLRFITLPYMALSGFLLIAVLLLASPLHRAATDKEASSS